MENIVSRLNDTFEDILPKLNGVYIGRLKSEMEAMYHFAYWLYCDNKSDDEVKKLVFNMAPFTLGDTTKPDLLILIKITMSTCIRKKNYISKTNHSLFVTFSEILRVYYIES